MDETLGNLLGSLVTLVAAFIGFSGVIYSQRKLMKLAEDERRHQEKLAKEQGDLERRRELNSFVNAIMGELSSLLVAIASARKLLAAQISLSEDPSWLGSGRKTQPRLAFRFATPVFDSHVARIGLLKPELSFQISNLYGRVMSFSTQSQDQVPEMEAAFAARVMRSVDDSLSTLAREIEELKSALQSEASAASLS